MPVHAILDCAIREHTRITCQQMRLYAETPNLAHQLQQHPLATRETNARSGVEHSSPLGAPDCGSLQAH
jgi:hypothetical protein